MGEILIVTGSAYSNNALFDEASPLNRDGVLRQFSILKKALGKKGICLKTADAGKIEKAKAIFFMEIPSPTTPYLRRALSSSAKESLFAILYEPPVVRPENYLRSLHAPFAKILTWHDSFVDGKKYIKNNFTMPFLQKEKIPLPNIPFSQKKLLCMVSANKYSPLPGQLYTKRAQAAKYMQKYHPHAFDLYGVGWNLPIFHSPLAQLIPINRALRATARLGPLSPFNLRKNLAYPSYKGAIKSKTDTMSKYKFCICFENQEKIPGYISEKIFDALIAGCVPIYLGASNIGKYVPKECFIDMRKFSGFGELHKFISSITGWEFLQYQRAAQNFLNSEKSAPFKIDAFVSNFKKISGV